MINCVLESIKNMCSGNNLVAYLKNKKVEQGYNLLNIIKKDIGHRYYSTLNNNKIEKTSTDAKLVQPIMSLRDIVEYKSGKVKTNPYQGLLLGKDKSKFYFGKARLYPTPSEYVKFNNIFD